MPIDYRCFFCFVKSFESLLENEILDQESKQLFTRDMAELFHREYNRYSSPEFSAELHRILKDYSDNHDPYKAVKGEYNDLVLNKYTDYKNQVQQSRHPFNTALRLAIAGNIIDFAASHQFDLQRTIDKVLHSEFAIDNSEDLIRAIDKADTILYLGDNAGEIVFDKLFIETFSHSSVFFAVRGAPVINDITMEDADYVGMGEVAEIISNGHYAPSTILERCSSEFRNVYDQADLIISKGQGNLEGLMEISDKDIYYLLMVKCEVIAEKLQVKKGDFVVSRNLM